MTTAPTVRFIELSLKNFKTFKAYRVRLDRTNILVGPNNAGKSTIIGCFRALEAALRTANAKRPSPITGLTGSAAMGWIIPDDGIPISLENTATDYSDDPATATFSFSNGNRLILAFQNGRPCRLFFEITAGSPLRTTTEFKEHFPIRVGAIPTLGAVEHEEDLVAPATVDRNLATHRASRNFRSYWWHHRNEFSDFQNALANSWPGMTVELPENDDGIIHFWCLESRITRELYWLGFGFQVWCQLLTHILRNRDATLLVLDEPETYLHPDVQRQLLGLLRETGADILLATHSTELLSEADPADVVIIDKRRSSAKRVVDATGVREAFQLLGSRRTYELSAIARSRRALFVEGDDFRLVRRIASALGYARLAASSGIAAVEMGGHRPELASAMASGITRVVDDALYGIMLDRDFRCSDEVRSIEERLQSFKVVATLGRKEIENYLLDPQILDAAIRAAIKDRLERGGRTKGEPKPAEDILMRATAGMRIDVQSQYVESWVEYHRGVGSPKNARSLNREATEWFEKAWASVQGRVRIVPGKDALHAVNSLLQDEVGITLTTATITEAVTNRTASEELKSLVRTLDDFRSKD